MWLLNPYRFAAAYDTDAAAYIAAVEAADGQTLETSVKDAINAFVVGCKADGIWTAIKASCIMAGARTLAGALVPLVGTAPTNFNFVAGDYNRKTGPLGDGSTKYLNSNRNNNADPQNNQHMGCWVSQAPSLGTFPIYIGTGDTANGVNNLGVGIAAGFVYVRSRNGTADTIAGVASSTGFIATARSSSASYLVRLNGGNTTFNRASQIPVNRNLLIFASTDDSGTNISQRSNSRLAFYSIGESLNLALLDARVTTLINAISAAIP